MQYKGWLPVEVAGHCYSFELMCWWAVGILDEHHVLACMCVCVCVCVSVCACLCKRVGVGICVSAYMCALMFLSSFQNYPL